MSAASVHDDGRKRTPRAAPRGIYVCGSRAASPARLKPIRHRRRSPASIMTHPLERMDSSEGSLSSRSASPIPIEFASSPPSGIEGIGYLDEVQRRVHLLGRLVDKPRMPPHVAAAMQSDEWSVAYAFAALCSHTEMRKVVDAQSWRRWQRAVRMERRTALTRCLAVLAITHRHREHRALEQSYRAAHHCRQMQLQHALNTIMAAAARAKRLAESSLRAICFREVGTLVCGLYAWRARARARGLLVLGTYAACRRQSRRALAGWRRYAAAQSISRAWQHAECAARLAYGARAGEQDTTEGEVDVWADVEHARPRLGPFHANRKPSRRCLARMDGPLRLVVDGSDEIVE